MHKKGLHKDCEVQTENPSLRTIVQHHFANLMMRNSYICDHRIFNPHLTTIKDSHIL